MRQELKGFSLVELLVVISILGFLGAIAMVIFTGVTAKARDGERIKALQIISQGLELYRSDNRFYPKSTGSNFSPETANFILTSSTDLTNCTGRSSACSVTISYLKTIPQDSDPSRDYVYSALPSGCDNSTTPCSSYLLCALKESSNTSNDLPSCQSYNCKFGEVCNIGISSR